MIRQASESPPYLKSGNVLEFMLETPSDKQIYFFLNQAEAYAKPIDKSTAALCPSAGDSELADSRS